MKIAKYLLTIFLLLCSAFFVFIATQQNKYKISREKEINIEKEILFNHINDLSTWEEWLELKGYDKSTILSYTAKTTNKSQSLTWKSSTLNDKITTTKSVPSDTIYQDIQIGNDKHKITWYFTSNNKSTKVNWSMEGKTSFRWKLNSFLKSGIDDIYGDLFEKGLNKIEGNLTTQLSAFKITQNGIVTRNANHFIQQKDSCSLDNFQTNYQKTVKNTKQFAKTNNLKTTDLPFIIVQERNKSKNYIIYSVCISTEEEILISEGSKITTGYFDNYLAYKTTVTGEYFHLESARKKTEEAILKLDYIINTNNNYIEIYKVGLTETKNASKWVTELYYPIKKKFIKPVETYIAPKKDSIKTIIIEQPVQ